MKIMNNKSIFTFLMILVLLLLAGASYYTFMAYNEYESTQKNTKSTYFIETLDDTLSKIAKERLYSAIYMSTNGTSGLEKVKESRT
jgi:CHASE3 domain sensor protein